MPKTTHGDFEEMTKQLFAEALQAYGTADRFRKCAEECNELAVAAVHYIDGKATAEEVLAEIGDVLLMTMQVSALLGADTDEWVRKSADKLLFRLVDQGYLLPA